jgi:Fe-S-cluster containining protein
MPPEPVDPRIRCDACAAVCCRLVVPLMPGDRIPAWLVDHDQEGFARMAHGADGWCVALDRATHRCTIHPRRPQLCRDFAMGGPSCRDEREAWYGHAAPGAAGD